MDEELGAPRPFALAFCGDVALDMIVTANRRTKKGREAYAQDLRLKLGGSAMNAYTEARRHQVNATIVSTVGDDDEGVLLRRRAESEGVNTQWITVNQETPTHICVIEVNKGTRTITGRPPPTHPVAPPTLPRAAYFVLSAYWFLRYDTEQLLGAFREQSALGGKIILDIPPGIPASAWQQWVDENLVDALVCSPSSLQRDYPPRTIHLEAFARDSGVTVLSHDGPEPVVLYTPSRTLHKAFRPMPRPENITGAGDALTAGFSIARMLNKTLDEQLEVAVRQAQAHLRRLPAN